MKVYDPNAVREMQRVTAGIWQEEGADVAAQALGTLVRAALHKVRTTDRVAYGYIIRAVRDELSGRTK